ncbi:MAG: hypothetical protein Q4D65_09770 [Peptostreptococcaceae bacterium]|nr:hypothetical protein [Peptostreptococcaceae bacterium]
MLKYYKLLDKVNYGTIIKAIIEKEKEKETKRRKFYQFVFGKDEWVETTIFLLYAWIEGDFFGEYKEIDEKTALEIIKKDSEKMDRLLENAKFLIKEAHKDQKDKAGEEYTKHLETVAKSVRSKYEDKEYEICALLHDILEDTDVTVTELRKIGFTERIINTIKVLTKKKREDYMEYIQRVKKDHIARAIKKEDLKHNMDISRIENPSESDIKRVEKYKKVLKLLEEY